MIEQERISREVVIANRTYPLKIFKQDEDKIVHIVKSINQKIEELRTAYDAKDNQDYLAMCLLQLYTQKPETNSSADIQLEPKVNQIEALLSQASLD